MAAPWTRSETLAAGQVFEFRLWAALVEQSRGQLHVFLPLTDRGIDGLAHRLADGTYFRLQAKGRSTLQRGEVHLVVRAEELTDDEALVVSGLLVDGGLGPTMMVVQIRDFKRLAFKSSADGKPVYAMAFGMRPGSTTRWGPYLTPAEKLVERFGVSTEIAASLEEAVAEPPPTWRSDLGFLGESEVMWLLARDAELNLFRPFPDLETAELAVLHRQNRRVVGLQIKTIGVDPSHPWEPVLVRSSSFRPSSSTYFTCLAWLPDEGRFHEEFLLIPSQDLTSITQRRESWGHLRFAWHPGSRSQPRLDPYRRRLSELRSAVGAILTSS